MYDGGVPVAAQCLGCGVTHLEDERICPKTKRPIEEGPFGSVVGPYRVGPLLGTGGFGVVHVAEDLRTGERVALKLLHPELVAAGEALDRFMREAEVTLRAGNPHIVRVLEGQFTGRSVFVALELLTGDTLANVMRLGRIHPTRAVDIAVQTLDGLALAHAAGVIHRDIKPANLFLADEPGAPRSLVKILDFGIGRLLVADQKGRLTRTGTQLGTPHYMAPEQTIDSKRADARADLYAVAVTLFTMLSGERPYGQISVAEWLGAVARGVPARPVSSPFGTLPPSLVEAIAIGLEVDPAKRFQDAGAFARALVDAVPDSPSLSRPLPALSATATFVKGMSLPPTVAERPVARSQAAPFAAPAAAAAPAAPAAIEEPTRAVRRTPMAKPARPPAAAAPRAANPRRPSQGLRVLLGAAALLALLLVGATLATAGALVSDHWLNAPTPRSAARGLALPLPTSVLPAPLAPAPLAPAPPGPPLAAGALDGGAAPSPLDGGREGAPLAPDAGSPRRLPRPRPFASPTRPLPPPPRRPDGLPDPWDQ